MFFYFQGAENVCDKLTTFKPFENAKAVAMNPDKPQQQARFLTLEVRFSLLFIVAMYILIVY